jgi:hypothetical protein
MKNAKNRKTAIKLLRPDEVWQPRIGGTAGNSNARKSGFYTSEWQALRKKIAAWRRRLHALGLR